jgi:proteasome lid subunit RPN8/RPN11
VSGRQRILKGQLRAVSDRAVRLARARQHEVCGLLVSHGTVLGLVELTNASRRRGHFQLKHDQVRSVCAAAHRLGSSVVGTFHSHIAWYAKPGSTDIAGAEDGSLMLIIDTIAREALLWRIHGCRAYKVGFELM